MRLVAGVDIGNATTEIVIADDRGEPVLADRAPTRGVKGSAASGAGAARLLARMERVLGREADVVVLTPQVPVTTLSADLPPRVVDTGRLRVLSAGSSTPAGSGLGAGRPIDVQAPPGDPGEPVVLVSRDPLGFRRTVEHVRGWRAAGARVEAVLLAGDEAVLVATRLADGGDPAIPVADCIDPDAALACTRIVVEVAGPGGQVRHVTDPIRVVAALGLGADEHADAVAACRLAQGSRVGVLGLAASPRPPATAPDPEEPWIALGDRVLPVRDARRALAELPVGTPSTIGLPGAEPRSAADAWLVDLDEVAGLPGLHPRTVARRSVVLSVLGLPSGQDDHLEGFRAERDRAVLVRESEAGAGRRGALTTPGASDDAVVIDLGGGTVDATLGPSSAVTASGSGAMMTTAVADALGISSGAAEWVKRGPASRIDAPHLAVRETGDREFCSPAAPSGTVGWLVVPGPGGSLPFTRDLELAEWRAVRLALKRAVFADNLARVLRTLQAPAGDVLLVGGPAADDELLDVLNGVLPGVVAGRGNVAGSLGPRWAVAYGLVLAALADGGVTRR